MDSDQKIIARIISRARAYAEKARSEYAESEVRSTLVLAASRLSTADTLGELRERTIKVLARAALDFELSTWSGSDVKRAIENETRIVRMRFLGKVLEEIEFESI